MPRATAAESIGPTLSRRSLLGRAAALGAVTVPAFVRGRALGLEQVAAAGERLTLGAIGVGPRCTYVLRAMLKMPGVQCVTLADVQARRRDAGKQSVDEHYGTADCATYRGFRELLARDDVDCVPVATGDRWHGPAAIAAAEAGKDDYCEKPCGLTIDVYRRIAETMRRTGRIFQAGTQRRSVANFIHAVDLARGGTLGRLTELHASGYTPQLHNDWLPAQPTPDRDTCDWNLSLGPASWRPYNEAYVNGKWRNHFDFEAGARLLEWGAHTVDLCQWANDADGATPVEFVPSADNISCRYANGVQVVLDFLPTSFEDRGPGWNTALGTCPVKFVGTEGWVSTGDEGATDAGPESLAASIPEAVKRVRGLDAAAHARNFFDCVKSRRPAACNADIMRTSHAAAHAAAMAWILGRPLTFDPATETFTTPSGPDHDANRLRVRPERDPWA